MFYIMVYVFMVIFLKTITIYSIFIKLGFIIKFLMDLQFIYSIFIKVTKVVYLYYS